MTGVGGEKKCLCVGGLVVMKVAGDPPYREVVEEVVRAQVVKEQKAMERAEQGVPCVCVCVCVCSCFIQNGLWV